MVWKQFEIGSTRAAAISSKIAAVSRIPNSLEIWWVGANGSVQDAFWYEGQDGWRQFEIAPAGSASPRGASCPVSRRKRSQRLMLPKLTRNVVVTSWRLIP